MKYKLFGSLITILTFGLLMTGCDIPGGDPWEQGILADRRSEAFHTFAVAEGRTYYIWVRGFRSNSVPSAELGDWADVVVAAKYVGGRTIFENTNAGANNSTAATSSWGASNFTAAQSGMVKIRVTVDQSLLSGGPGQYWVTMSTNNRRPAY